MNVSISSAHTPDTGIGSTYAWFIVILGALTNMLCVGVPLMSLPVFFKAIASDLDLNLVQIGMAWGMGSFASMLTNPFGGLISDRFGIKRVMSITCILAGLAGAARGLAVNYVWLLVAVFAVGFVQNTIVMSVHKIAGIWFSGQKVVVANGIVSTGIALGMMLGAMFSDTFLAPLLGGWRHVLIFYGGITIAMGMVWSLTRKEPAPAIDSSDREAQTGRHPDFKRSVLSVLKTKRVWSYGWIHLCVIGCIMGVIGYLPLYLRSIGWAPTAADGALASLNAAGMLGALPLSLISGRFGLRKGILIPAIALAMFSIALLPFVSDGLIWPLVIFFGLLRDGYFAILMTMIMESKGIGPRYAGTAMGMIFSIGNIGVFLAAPIGNHLAETLPAYAFLFWALLLLFSLVTLIFTGSEPRTNG